MKEVLQNKEKRQVLIRKCIIDMCAAVKRFEDNVKRVAFVIDSSSWRYNFYDNYKYALTRVRDDYYKEFLEVLNEFEALLRKKGIIVSRVKGAEGDDLLYVWSLYFGYVLDEELVIVTGDSDIRQIINKNVSLFNNNSKNLKFYCISEREVYWNEYLDADIQVVPTKPFEVLLYKVILGDKSDNIPSVIYGCGEKAIELLINEAIKNNIDPDSETLWEELGDLVDDIELGRHKNLINIQNPENKLIYERNKKLVDFRMAQIPMILNENLNEILSLDFDEAADIIRELEFKSLSKIIIPGSPWYRLK